MICQETHCPHSKLLSYVTDSGSFIRNMLETVSRTKHLILRLSCKLKINKIKLGVIFVLYLFAILLHSQKKCHIDVESSHPMSFCHLRPNMNICSSILSSGEC